MKEESGFDGLLERIGFMAWCLVLFWMLGTALVFVAQIVLSVLTRKSWIKRASAKNGIWAGVGFLALCCGPAVISGMKADREKFDYEVTGQNLHFKKTPEEPVVYIPKGTCDHLPLTPIATATYRIETDQSLDELRVLDGQETLRPKINDHNVLYVRIVQVLLMITGFFAFYGGVKGKEYE